MRKLGFRTSRGRSTLLSDFLFECTKKKNKTKQTSFFHLVFFKTSSIITTFSGLTLGYKRLDLLFNLNVKSGTSYCVE